MDSSAAECKARDILSRPLLAAALFVLPPIAMVVSGTSYFSNAWRTAVWTAALGVMAAGCILNARRCGRVHCYATGPFFLVMAGIALLYGSGVLPLGRGGWNLIGLTTLIGAVVLCCLPELILGKYRKGRTTDHHGDGSARP